VLCNSARELRVSKELTFCVLAIQWARRLLFLFVVEKLFGGWVMFVSIAFNNELCHVKFENQD
jgi:hypothetical protein